MKYILITARICCLLLIVPQLKAQQILMPYRKGNLWGYADTTGKIIVTPQFSRTDLFKDDFNYASVVNSSEGRNYLGVVKNTGELIIAPTKFTSYDIASRSFNFYGGPPTYLPERLERTKQKNYYSKLPHWTDSLPVFFLARISSRYAGKDSIYLVDSTGKQLTYDPVEQIGVFSYAPLTYTFLVKKNSKLGVIAQNGKTIIPVEYDKLECVHDENGRYVIIAQKNGKFGLVTMDNKVLLPIIYDDIRKELYDYSSHFVLAVRKKNEEAVYEPNEKLVDDFKPGKVSVIDDHSGVNRKYIIKREPIPNNAADMAIGVIAVPKEEERTGMAVKPAEDTYSIQNKNSSNNYATPQIYTDNELYGLKKGDSILITPQYQSLSQLWINGNAYYLAVKNDKRGIVGQYNETFIPLKFTSLALYFHHTRTGQSLFKVADNKGKFGIISLDNKVIVPVKYLSIEKSEKPSMDNDINFACSNGVSTIVYNRNGDILFTGNYIAVKPLLMDMDSLPQQVWVVYEKNGNAGVINNKGAYLISPAFKQVTLFEARTNYHFRKFIAVKTAEGKQGLYSLNGLQMCPPVYDTFIPFQNKGNYTTVSPKADTVYYFVTGKNGMYGITDMWGNDKLPHNYGSKFAFLSVGYPYIIVEKDKQVGLATFSNPDLVIPQENIVFPGGENGEYKMKHGIVLYKNADSKDNNLGAFIFKDGKLFKQIPARYKHDWGGLSSSVNRKYFSFLALEYTKDNQMLFDYVGYNGVQFFED